MRDPQQLRRVIAQPYPLPSLMVAFLTLAPRVIKRLYSHACTTIRARTVRDGERLHAAVRVAAIQQHEREYR